MNKKKLKALSDELLETILMTEAVKDACIANEQAGCEAVLNIILDKQQDLYEEIEFMY